MRLSMMEKLKNKLGVNRRNTHMSEKKTRAPAKVSATDKKTQPAKRGRKPKDAVEAVVTPAPKAPAKRGRKPKVAETTPAPKAPEKLGKQPKLTVGVEASVQIRKRSPKAVAAETAEVMVEYETSTPTSSIDNRTLGQKIADFFIKVFG